MKKILLVLLGVILTLACVLAYSKMNVNLGIQETNDIPFLTTTATTTGSYISTRTLPVKVLSTDYGRQYAIITNNSATAGLYLFFPEGELDYNFTAMATGYTSASSTISTTTYNQGVYVGPMTSYVIDADNLIHSSIWATSTVVNNAQVNVSYR
jgi:hypothetical protein